MTGETDTFHYVRNITVSTLLSPEQQKEQSYEGQSLTTLMQASRGVTF